MSMKRFTNRVAFIWIMAAIAVVITAALWVVQPWKVQGAQNIKDIGEYNSETNDTSSVLEKRKDEDSNGGVPGFLRDIAEYIRAAAYSEIGRSCDEYSMTMKLSELYDEPAVDTVSESCVRILREHGIAADKDILKNTYVDVLCRLNMGDESRERAASMLEKEISGYIARAASDNNDIDIADLGRAVREYITKILSGNKEDIKFDTDILTSDRDIIIQLLKANGMSRDDAENACKEVIPELNAVYANMGIDALQSLLAKSIENAADNISDGIYNSVTSAVSSYNENIENITKSINQFSGQYQTMKADIDAIRGQIGVLEAQIREMPEDSPELLKKLEDMKRHLNEGDKSLEALAGRIDELELLKENISVLSVSHDNAKAEVQKSVEVLKSELINIIESIKEQNAADNADNKQDREQMEALIADIRGILDKLDSEKLTVSEFEIYNNEIESLIAGIEADANLNIDNLRGSLNDKMKRLSDNFSEYMIMSEAKQNEDKKMLYKNFEDMQNRADSTDDRLGTVEKRYSYVDSELALLDDRISSLENDFMLSDDKISSLESDLMLSDNRISSLEGDFSALESRLEDTEGGLEALDSRLAKAESGITAFDDGLAEAENRLTALDDRLAKAEGGLTALDGRLAAVENSFSALDGRLAAAESGFARLDKGYATLTEENTKIKSSVSDNAARISELEKSVISLGKALSDGKAKVAAAVTANGVFTDTSADFDTIAANINLMAEQSKKDIKYASVSVSANNTSDVTYSTYEEFDTDECSRFEVAFPPNSFICYRMYGKGEGYNYASDWHEPCRDNYIYVADGGKDKWVLTGPNWHNSEFEKEGLTLTVEYWYIPE